MKYLHKFNESTSDDVLEFCNDNLASLVDHGFEVFVDNKFVDYSMRVFIFNDFKRKFKWVDVQEEIMPFLQMVISRYKVKNNELFFQMYASRSIILDITEMIADDNLFPPMDIENISFVI